MLQRRSLEKGKEKTTLEGARPPNLLNIALCWLASSCLHLALFAITQEVAPCSKYPRSMHVHAKTKETSQQTSKETNKRKSMLKTSQEKMPNGANKHVKHTKRQKKTCFKTRRQCPRRKNAGLDRVCITHWIEVWMTHRLMHEHVGKRATRKHRSKESQTGGTKQARQAYQHHMGWRKV